MCACMCICMCVFVYVCVYVCVCVYSSEYRCVSTLLVIDICGIFSSSMREIVQCTPCELVCARECACVCT